MPAESLPHECADPRVEALVTELIGRVADKWTMILLEVLEEHDQLRFTQISYQSARDIDPASASNIAPLLLTLAMGSGMGVRRWRA